MTQPRARRGLASWLLASRTPIFVLDERRVVLVFNAGCEELTGWSAADVIGKTCAYQTEANPQLVGAITGALCPPAESLSGAPSRRRAVIPRRDGSVLEQEVHYYPLTPIANGEPLHLLGIICGRQETTPKQEGTALDAARLAAGLYRKYGVERIVARSPALLRVAAQIELARGTRATVHLRGERGAGKEHVARLIHYGGAGRQSRFIPLRCNVSGHFELSRTLQRLAEGDAREGGGTVYLDQAPALPRDLQTLALALAERGDWRWMSSSSLDLNALDDEAFDPALRARLTSLVMDLPPLRERGEDLLPLAQQLLEEANRAGGRQHEGFAPTAERAFRQYGWPGNVDELAAVIGRACERAQGVLIELGDLPFEFQAGRAAQEVRPAASPPASLDEQLAELERSIIVQALEAARGNKSLTAEALGIPRPKLYRRLEALGLEPSASDDGPEEPPGTEK